MHCPTLTQFRPKHAATRFRAQVPLNFGMPPSPRQIWPNSVDLDPTVAAVGPQLVELCHNVAGAVQMRATFGPELVNIGECLGDSGEFCPTLAEVGSDVVEFGPTLTNIRPCLADGRFRQNFAQLGPRWPRILPISLFLFIATPLKARPKPCAAGL